MSRAVKPITELATRVLRDDGTAVLDGAGVCYTMPSNAQPGAVATPCSGIP